ncbi:hypothetical protein H8959_019372 [Pygathrix nigripes]
MLWRQNPPGSLADPGDAAIDEWVISEFIHKARITTAVRQFTVALLPLNYAPAAAVTQGKWVTPKALEVAQGCGPFSGSAYSSWAPAHLPVPDLIPIPDTDTST